MKIVKIFFGLLAGLYAGAQAVNSVLILARDEHISRLLGALGGLCIGAAICVALFRSAFKKKEVEE